MISLQISNTKAFMSKLFLSDYFDSFLLSEASFTTFSTFHIDGRFHKDFYSSEELDTMKLTNRAYSSWQQIRPFCLSLIKGTHTPLDFKIIFRLSPEKTEQFLAAQNLPFSAGDISGLFLNLHFSSNSLICTTGSALQIFSMDKSLDHAWDDAVKNYLFDFC